MFRQMADHRVYGTQHGENGENGKLDIVQAAKEENLICLVKYTEVIISAAGLPYV